MLFFFSSRRRHTRFDCDWSSDVCSSDLARLSASISTSSSIRFSALGAQVGWITNTSCLRTFSSISTCTSPSEKCETSALPGRTPSSLQMFCARRLLALPEKTSRFGDSCIMIVSGGDEWRGSGVGKDPDGPLLLTTPRLYPRPARAMRWKARTQPLLAGAVGFEPTNARIKTWCLGPLGDAPALINQCCSSASSSGERATPAATLARNSFGNFDRPCSAADCDANSTKQPLPEPVSRAVPMPLNAASAASTAGSRRRSTGSNAFPTKVPEAKSSIFATGLSRVKSGSANRRSEEHTSELQSQSNLVCRLLLEKKKKQE